MIMLCRKYGRLFNTLTHSNRNTLHATRTSINRHWKTYSLKLSQTVSVISYRYGFPHTHSLTHSLTSLTYTEYTPSIRSTMLSTVEIFSVVNRQVIQSTKHLQLYRWNSLWKCYDMVGYLPWIEQRTERLTRVCKQSSLFIDLSKNLWR